MTLDIINLQGEDKMRKNVKKIQPVLFVLLAALWMAMYSRTALAQDMNAAEDFGGKTETLSEQEELGGWRQDPWGWRYYTADGGYYV